MKPGELTVQRQEAGQTLQEFLAARLSLSRHRAKVLLDNRGVFVNGRRVWMARHTLRAADRVDLIAVTPPRSAGSVQPVILYQDDDYIVVDKPVGLLANGPNSIEEALRRHCRAPELAAAHRLDRDTSGCLLCARHPAALGAILPLFRERAIHKMYHAIAIGRVDPPEQTLRMPVEGEPAVTHIKRLHGNEIASHVLARIDTGRTHQIRRHLAAIGHPVLGDRAYSGRTLLPPRLRSVPRQMLHASAIELRHPLRCSRLEARSPLPPDFRRCLSLLRLT